VIILCCEEERERGGGGGRGEREGIEVSRCLEYNAVILFRM